MTPYDPDNVFAKILRGDLPCHKVHEDADCLAFMDIMPRAPGHTLVIPKAPARTILDIVPASLTSLALAVQRVAKGVKAGMKADGLTIQQFNEPAGGQVVFHIHFHIIPRWNGQPLGPHASQMAPGDQLAAHAASIRAALG